MSPRTVVILLIVLLLLFGFGGFAPDYGYWHHSYGWGPTGGAGFIVVILLILLVLGVI